MAPKEASRSKASDIRSNLSFTTTKANPRPAPKLVEKLITEDKVDLLLGGFGSSQIMAASAVSEKFRYPMTSGAASTLRLFDRGFKYYFSLLGKAPEEVRGCVEILPIPFAHAQIRGHHRGQPSFSRRRGGWFQAVCPEIGLCRLSISNSSPCL